MNKNTSFSHTRTVAKTKVNTRTGAICFLVILLLSTILFKPYKNGPPIRSDGAGYHIWVGAFRSLDLNFCKFKKELGLSISVVNEQNGVCGVKYPPGVALLQAPFTILSPVPAKSNKLFSDYSHYMVLLIGSMLLLGSMWLLSRCLSMYGEATDVMYWVMAIGIFGTGVFHYATYDASFSHIYSTFGVSAALYFAVKLKKQSALFSNRDLALWGLTCFWLYLVRQTNIFPIVLICLLAVFPNPFTKQKIVFAGTGAIASILGLALLLAYNHYVTGDIVVSSYGNEKFHSIGKFSLDVLFSFERGLFVYYPAVALALFLSFLSKDRYLTACLVIITAAYTLLYGSWHSWFLGGGMGHRGFVESIPVAILASALGANRVRSIAAKRTLAMLGILCTYVTVAVMVSYWDGSYPFGGANKSLYMKTVFGLE